MLKRLWRWLLPLTLASFLAVSIASVLVDLSQPQPGQQRQMTGAGQ